MFFTASDFTFTTRHIHNWVSFLVWLSLFILSEAISLLFSSSISDTYWLGRRGFIFQCHIKYHGCRDYSMYNWNLGPDLLLCVSEFTKLCLHKAPFPPLKPFPARCTPIQTKPSDLRFWGWEKQYFQYAWELGLDSILYFWVQIVWCHSSSFEFLWCM